MEEDITHKIIENKEPSARQWLFSLMQLLSHEHFVLTGVTLWAIWMTHRKVIHENIFQPPMSTHMFVKSFINDLDQITKKEVKPNSPVPETSGRHD